MVKKILYILLIALLLIPLISAVDTEIIIKTMPNHEVQVAVSNPASLPNFELLEHFIGNSDEYGDISFNFSSNKSSFNLNVFIKKDNEKIISKNYADTFIAGELVYLEIVPDGFEIINKSAENTDESLNNGLNGSEDEAKITGSVFGERSFFSNNIIYYIAIGAVLLIAAGFLIAKRMHKIRSGLNNSKKNLEKQEPETPQN